MVTPRSTPRRGQRSGSAQPLRRARERWAWLFLLPSLLVAAMVAGWPLARTATLAFTDATLGSPAAPQWVGLENLIWLLSDDDWWNSVWNTLVFTLCSVPLELAFGLSFALLLNSGFRGSLWLRPIALVPWVVPTVVAAQTWSWMYHDVYGIINSVMVKLGLLEAPVAWLADSTTALAAVIVTDVWKATPFMTLLLLAGLQSIPRELYAAAQLDGAGPVARFRFITLPMLKPAILVALVFRTLDALRVFDLIYVMTGSTSATSTISVYARQQLIDFQDTGFGSAASLAIFVLVGVASLGYIALLKPSLEEGR